MLTMTLCALLIHHDSICSTCRHSWPAMLAAVIISFFGCRNVDEMSEIVQVRRDCMEEDRWEYYLTPKYSDRNNELHREKAISFCMEDLLNEQFVYVVSDKD